MWFTIKKEEAWHISRHEEKHLGDEQREVRDNAGGEMWDHYG